MHALNKNPCKPKTVRYVQASCLAVLCTHNMVFKDWLFLTQMKSVKCSVIDICTHIPLQMYSIWDQFTESSCLKGFQNVTWWVHIAFDLLKTPKSGFLVCNVSTTTYQLSTLKSKLPFLRFICLQGFYYSIWPLRTSNQRFIAT